MRAGGLCGNTCAPRKGTISKITLAAKQRKYVIERAGGGGGIRPGPSEAPGTGLCCDAAVGTQNVTLLNFLRAHGMGWSPVSHVSPINLYMRSPPSQSFRLAGGSHTAVVSVRCGSGRATMVRTCLRLTTTHRLRRRSPPPVSVRSFGRAGTLEKCV